MPLAELSRIPDVPDSTPATGDPARQAPGYRGALAVTAESIARQLATDSARVADCLRRIQHGDDIVVTLDILELVATAAKPLPVLVAELVNGDGRAVLYEALMRGSLTGGPPEMLRDAADPEAYAVLESVAGAFDVEKLADLATRCLNFRCRIAVNGQIRGSGSFVSPRLVLTAWHVIGAKGRERHDPSLQIEVLAEDGRRYPATVAFEDPCHPDEWGEAAVDLDDACETHDVALLRIRRPLGYVLGATSLPEEPKGWEGWQRIFLVHFPEGAEWPGVLAEALGRDGACRLVHTARTSPGSSGGPAFDSGLRLVGFHQGRVENQRRLVPVTRFAALPKLRDEIVQDLVPRYLWSLDGSLEGHFVVARTLFFDALHEILAGRAGMLRGIWVRRTDPGTDDHGLGFSYDLLTAFLAAHGRDTRVWRVQLDLDDLDLFDRIAAVALPARAAAGRARSFSAAEDAGRARDLARELARARNDPAWIYFDNPAAGLTARGQLQFEQFVAEALNQSGLRFVIAGLETLNVPYPYFRGLEQAASWPRPCILAEYLGEFGREDVTRTVREMCASIGLNWHDEVIAEMVRRALRGLEQRGGRYRDSDLGLVAERLRDDARKSAAA
jgi:hypothetical protein